MMLEVSVCTKSDKSALLPTKPNCITQQQNGKTTGEAPV